MDGTRFDRLTRAFARVGTRRQVVAGVAVVAVGAGGLEAADAATRAIPFLLAQPNKLNFTREPQPPPVL